MLIDSHCHLQTLEEGELDEALEAARRRGVRGFLVPATRLDEADDLLAMAHRHADVWCALGVHPHEASSWRRGDKAALRSLLADDRVVAVGECGLDFHYDHSPRDVQIRALGEQWELALEEGLPVVVHNRDSDETMLELLAAREFDSLEADFHSFSGSPALARAVIDRGLYLGFSGMVTFRRADNVRQVLREAPRERILVETDTPYLAPVPYRGRANRPAYVVEVAAAVAGELGVEPETVHHLTGEAFFRLFARARVA